MTLEQLCQEHRFTLPKRSGNWHVLGEQPIGQVNAIDSLRGKLMAVSDKGLGLILTHQGLVIGHKDWFVKDVVVTEPRSVSFPITDKRLEEFEQQFNMELVK